MIVDDGVRIVKLVHCCRDHPVLAFFLFAYGISWGGIFLLLADSGFNISASSGPRFHYIFAFMLLGPGASGLMLTAMLDGRAGLHDLWLRITLWRVSPPWYAIALLTAPVTMLLVLWPLSAFVDPAFAPQFHPALFVIGLVAGMCEEIGWTGFATPRLLQRHNVLIAGFLIGLPWAIWHALADATGNIDAMGVGWFGWFAVFWLATLPAYRILMTWVYANTSSVLLAILMHAGYTGWLFVFFPVTSHEQGLLWQGAFAAGLWLLVAYRERRTTMHEGVNRDPNRVRESATDIPRTSQGKAA
jgi:uncharacterized protein